MLGTAHRDGLPHVFASFSRFATSGLNLLNCRTNSITKTDRYNTAPIIFTVEDQKRIEYHYSKKQRGELKTKSVKAFVDLNTMPLSPWK